MNKVEEFYIYKISMPQYMVEIEISRSLHLNFLNFVMDLDLLEDGFLYLHLNFYFVMDLNDMGNSPHLYFQDLYVDLNLAMGWYLHFRLRWVSHVISRLS